MPDMEVLVYSPAAAMGSKKAFVNKRTGRAVVVDDRKEKLRSFQAEMKDAMRAVKPAEPLRGAARVQIIFWIKRPQGHFGTGRNAGVLKDSAPVFPCVTPDQDKVERAILDCMSGIWLIDDKQVCDCRVQKRYVGLAEEERVWVRVQMMGE